ncbi:MAG: helix-turn-helix transcriptional regulator [Gammaproteobacteria bacterium]|nr:helix-turn-helix transcriptional regulator [Gammaproteobacteria bacterium]
MDRRRVVVTLKPEPLWERLAVLGRSQNWLAREAGISRGYLSMLVNGKRSPSGRIRRRLLRILELEDFHELFTLRSGRDEP